MAVVHRADLFDLDCLCSACVSLQHSMGILKGENSAGTEESSQQHSLPGGGRKENCRPMLGMGNYLA